jgi:hypothetical protein
MFNIADKVDLLAMNGAILIRSWLSKHAGSLGNGIWAAS